MSQQIWYDKLKTYVPSWVFEKFPEGEAIFRGMASALSLKEEEYLAHIQETTIDGSSEEFLEFIGSERGIERLLNESLAAYRKRVKVIKNRSSCPEIKELIDTVLINGESTIIPHSDPSFLFYGRSAFYDRGTIETDRLYNSYTVIFPDQTREAVSFYGRENFSDREKFYGELSSSLLLFQQIAEIIDKNKAFGTFYRFYEQNKEVL